MRFQYLTDRTKNEGNLIRNMHSLLIKSLDFLNASVQVQLDMKVVKITCQPTASDPTAQHRVQWWVFVRPVESQSLQESSFFFLLLRTQK